MKRPASLVAAILFLLMAIAQLWQIYFCINILDS